MSELVPVISYAIGTVTLFGASVYAVKNYRITHEISRYWMVYAISMVVGGLVSLIFFIQFTYGTTPLLDDTQTALSGIFAIMLVVVAINMVTTDIAEVLE